MQKVAKKCEGVVGWIACSAFSLFVKMDILQVTNDVEALSADGFYRKVLYVLYCQHHFISLDKLSDGSMTCKNQLTFVN